MSESVVGAIDIGGKSIKTGLVGSKGLMHIQPPCPLPLTPDLDSFFGALKEAVEDLLQTAIQQGRVMVGIGLGVPGLVDSRTGIAHFSTNLRWGPTDFRSVIGEWSRLPVHIEHDVRCGAIAEMHFGELREERDFLYVAIGTGIGGSLGFNGQLYTGHTGFAGEIGHTTIYPDGRKCTCGRVGCLEAYCSAKHIETRYKEKCGIHRTCEEIGTLARNGDQTAATVWSEAMTTLARALINYSTLLSPKKVVIGGGVSAAGADMIVTPVQLAMKSIAPDLILPTITLSYLGQHSGLVGAGFQAYRKVNGVNG